LLAIAAFESIEGIDLCTGLPQFHEDYGNPKND
jgi:hypothetical protein